MADMSTPEPAWEYSPPKGGEVIEYQVVLAPEHQLHVRQTIYRKMVVDFAIMQFFVQEWRAEVHRTDCCHGEVHAHQFFQGVDSEERSVICVIDRVDAWKTVDRNFVECNDRAVESFATYYDRWRAR
ncbi:hypothetical protein NMQ01_09260 [Janibacter sp. CX7]|uniref:hypothetical protein n=1 Tax=Janibacter sp. CX7 TaxID=2963431 RepID=UPI0020CFA9C2|nr:hypothetical protein [Janibacter sp. CX7]UTT64923.1 hypothetical protein NMQ01_09260 [Janibacter sp. CX7]